jgi:hypothetical protein
VQNNDSNLPASRIHDLKEVYRDLGMIIELLKADYAFGKDEKLAVIAQLEKSLKILNTEILTITGKE